MPTRRTYKTQQYPSSMLTDSTQSYGVSNNTISGLVTAGSGVSIGTSVNTSGAGLGTISIQPWGSNYQLSYNGVDSDCNYYRLATSCSYGLNEFLEDNELCEFTLVALMTDPKTKNALNMRILCKSQKLSEHFLNKYYSELDIDDICHFQNLSMDFITEHIKDINASKDALFSLSAYQALSRDFVLQYKSILDWGNILHNNRIQLFYEDIESNIKLIASQGALNYIICGDGNQLSNDEKNKIINKFGEKYVNDLDWQYISWYAQDWLSEENMEKYMDKIDFNAMYGRKIKNENVRCYIILKFGDQFGKQ